MTNRLFQTGLRRGDGRRPSQRPLFGFQLERSDKLQGDETELRNILKEATAIREQARSKHSDQSDVRRQNTRQ